MPRYGNFNILFIGTFTFILCCTLTLMVNINSITKTCKLDDTDKEHNIMNSKYRGPDLIIIILSAPINVKKRQLIRNTWTKLYGRKQNNLEQTFIVKYYFVIGNFGLDVHIKKQMTDEQMTNKDLLILPILDDYKNITYKVKQTFQWLSDQYDYGMDFKYVLKCDDDSFVHLKSLVGELIEIEKLYLSPPSLKSVIEVLKYSSAETMSANIQANNKDGPNKLNLYWGYFYGNARIFTKGKWKETEWIFSDRYMPYALGGGYLLSKNLVTYIGKNAENLRTFNAEDVSVGFWLAPVDNILRIHDTRFDTEWKSRGCQNQHLIVHHVSPEEMLQYYKNVEENVAASFGGSSWMKNNYLFCYSL
ncbi:unnamed protein product [Acanthoscelides obtectus]|uniref:Hexosyltransferase n=1 Tax=Acanthoscelides obtectus TaxID=200917 RepID=A0A9P0PID0_ACAOB|nr:unnamed protein product [Acanthoscelides obtectus]CAK1630401.1 Beta-1,3-galactosyltransferase 6 [Acanthoscelides obtectus]